MFQIWVSGFAAFYSFDSAISAWLSPASLRRPHVLRAATGAALAVAMFAMGRAHG